jgi:pimeloyl-ACP methyl ester carboxylesterase
MFISGELSNYVRPENHEIIYRMFPKAEFAVITGAGHWVHADQPEQLVSRVNVKEFLGGQSQPANVSRPSAES